MVHVAGPVTTTAHPEQIRLPFVLMRGGTSKAVFVRDEHLPADPQERDRVILAFSEAPTLARSTVSMVQTFTSKLAIIGEATRPDADLDFTFAQVSVSEAVMDPDINYGNISAAVGSHAVDEGLVASQEPITTVRIHNTNTGRVLLADVPVSGGDRRQAAGMHKAYPGTVSVGTAVAASIPGTIAQSMSNGRTDDELTIGHPSGTMPVGVRVEPSGEGWTVKRAAYRRTARRLAEGSAFVRWTAWSHPPTPE